MDIIENDVYHQLLLFYKGKNAEKDLLEDGQDALQNTTLRRLQWCRVSVEDEQAKQTI